VYSWQEREGEPQVKRIEKGDKKYTGSRGRRLAFAILRGTHAL